MFDAAVSITFNVGCSKMKTSTMYRYLNLGEYERACNELPRWNKSAGNVLNSLVIRRAKERELCLLDLNLSLVITMTTVFGLLITVLFDIKNTYLEFGSIKTELSQVKAEFNQYQMIVQKVNDIDNKFTHDLANTKSENNNLYDNVINYLGRLQLNLSKAEQSTTSSMDDGVFYKLTGEARQNYYLLR